MLFLNNFYCMITLIKFMKNLIISLLLLLMPMLPTHALSKEDMQILENVEELYYLQVIACNKYLEEIPVQDPR